MDLQLKEGKRIRNLAWMCWLPYPPLPFYWFRVAQPRAHHELEIEEYRAASLGRFQLLGDLQPIPLQRLDFCGGVGLLLYELG